MKDTHCIDCDMLLATQEDYDAHEPGCHCAHCVSLCWRAWNGECCNEPHDWRAEALNLRAMLAKLVSPIEVTTGEFLPE